MPSARARLHVIVRRMHHESKYIVRYNDAKVRLSEFTINNGSLQRSDEGSGVTDTSWYEILLHQNKGV